MKSQIVILSVLILSAFVSGMSLSGCEDDTEDSQLKKVLKSANCVMNSHVDKIKRGIGHFRGGFWKNFEKVNGFFVRRKGSDDIDFDEIDVTEEEEIVTMKEKREKEANDDEKVDDPTTETPSDIEGETTENSPDYLVPQVFNILRAPTKCASGQKLVANRCRTIY